MIKLYKQTYDFLNSFDVIFKPWDYFNLIFIIIERKR